MTYKIPAKVQRNIERGGEAYAKRLAASMLPPGETYADSIAREVGAAHAMMAYDSVGSGDYP